MFDLKVGVLLTFTFTAFVFAVPSSPVALIVIVCIPFVYLVVSKSYENPALSVT